MGWTYIARHPHVCDTPKKIEYAEGSRWECYYCGAIWKVQRTDIYGNNYLHRVKRGKKKY